MAGKLITLPLRVSLRSARLLTRVAVGAAGQACSLTGRTISAVTPGRARSERPADVWTPEPRESPESQSPEPRESQSPEPRESPESQSPEPRESQSPEPQSAESESPESRLSEAASSTPPSVRRSPLRPAPPPPEAPVAHEPAHVSEEPELVREFAEPGAEEGAGATINVVAPWDGYERMNAKDVIERARRANPAELAAVRLYEARHRSRQTVLAAVDRQLRLGNGGTPA